MNQENIKAYYASGIEKDRLELEYFKLEGLRTKEIISRYVPQAPANIIDIGGGAGFYSFWLAKQGHNVHLVDLSEHNISLAKEKAQQENAALIQCQEGDARNLAFGDNQFDIALVLGPLYHLTEKQDRIKALQEAKRVLKPGGILLAAVISRYASLMDGFKRDLIHDEAFQQILSNDLKTGVHLNTTNNFEYFTTSFFHSPADIQQEISESGLAFKKLIAIESIGWIIDDFQRKAMDAGYYKTVRGFIEQVESKEDVVAFSPHIMAVAEKV